MTVNTARYEESTEIILDSETVTPEAHVTLNYASANRVGGLVAVHLEGSYASEVSGTAFQAAQLPGDFVPGAAVTPLFSGAATAMSIDTNGVLHITPNATGGNFVVDVVYAAGQVSP